MRTGSTHGKGGDYLGTRMIGGLLVFIAVIAVLVVIFYVRDPSQGPGNVPATGPVTPLHDNGSPTTTK